MPTKKKRINITLSKEMAVFLKRIALRDEVPEATKAAELLEEALELVEDEYFSALADKRVKEGGKFYSHREAWKKR